MRTHLPISSLAWRCYLQEEMDMEAFGMLDDEDLQEMGIAKGPRLKLLQAISQVRNQ
jgi:hypothetical protein